MKNRITNFTVGADPELFLEQNGKIISSEGIIGGSKHKPKRINGYGRYVQEDNVMVEFNIPPCESKEDFVNEINAVKDWLHAYVSLKGYNLNYSSSAFLDEKYLKTPQALEFGCEPDYNVYLKDINQPPDSTKNLRSCGGHIHIGYNDPDQETTEHIVYAMDIMLGLDSIILDNDRLRRTMYGKAGCFRFKDYGLEYRTLSNFWIKNDTLITWVYERVEKAIDLVNSGLMPSILNLYENNIRKAIDSGDIEFSIEVYNSILEFIEVNKKEKITKTV